MTGFASLERQYDFGRLTWEMRSLNHRYLEFSLRLPEEFRVLEPQIRKVLGKFLSRGKIDASLRFQLSPGAAGSNIVLNSGLAANLIAIHAQMQELSDLLPI